MMQVIVMELLLKNKFGDRSLPIAGVTPTAAIIPRSSRRFRRLIHSGRNFAEDISATMSFAEQQYFV